MTIDRDHLKELKSRAVNRRSPEWQAFAAGFAARPEDATTCGSTIVVAADELWRAVRTAENDDAAAIRAEVRRIITSTFPVGTKVIRPSHAPNPIVYTVTEIDWDNASVTIRRYDSPEGHYDETRVAAEDFALNYELAPF